MRTTERAPTGLPDDHILFAIDYIVDEPFLTDVYDPHWASLTADGTLVYERRDVDAILGTTVTKLDAAGLDEAWSAILRSGVYTDGHLVLPGFPQGGAPRTAFVRRKGPSRLVASATSQSSQSVSARSRSGAGPRLDALLMRTSRPPSSPRICSAIG